ncbi:hypothetical protein HPP92_027086 [Vanilla planifolia]|uniref:Filament-like plant protein n=1 Tax=Vanilla planifolia TaxID=51239 RepID=A0A835PB88_VANPL|nr:hypothetical protein HPP92_027086 [Vanilla planifolia]
MKENCDESSSVDVHIDVCKEQIPGLIKHPNVDLQTDDHCTGNWLSKLEMRIASVIESKVPDDQMGKLLEEIMAIVQDDKYDLLHHSKDISGEGQCRVGEAPQSEASLNHDGNLCRQPEINMNQELTTAVSWIHDFVMSFYKEASQTKPFEVQATRERVEEFSDSMCKLLSNKLNLDAFVVALYHILAEIIELRSKPWDMGENNSVACIDKVTLLENGIAAHHPIEGNLSGVHGLLPQSNTDAFGGPNNASAELKDASQSFPMEEFEHMKLERDNLEADLTKCRETLGNTKLQLTETEQHLAELKLQLSACQKSNVLADTQLRCMTESYKCLESHVEQLESELSLLKSKAETLESELDVERHSHQEDISKYTDLQEYMRFCVTEREIAAAAEKLAACQETIVLLNKQLTALCPTAEPISMSSRFVEEVKMDSFNSQSSQFSSFGDYATEISPREGIESPPHEYSSQVSTSDMELNTTPKKSAKSKRSKHRSKSPSASSLSSLLNEKQERVFSRFFVKGKTEI